jgi:purine-binding chemotaxis protein CheW
MERKGLEKKKDERLDLATFFVGDVLYGIDILNIQEINRHVGVTAVPQAPLYVEGVLNLRGRIVTVIDLGKKLGVSPIQAGRHNRNIIIDSEDEYIGLLVDRILDVMTADKEKIEPAPANIGGIQGRYFEGVYKTDTRLIGILNINEVLSTE